MTKLFNPLSAAGEERAGERSDAGVSLNPRLVEKYCQYVIWVFKFYVFLQTNFYNT